MDTAMAWVLVVIALVVLLPLIARPVVAGIYWVLTGLGQGMYYGIDRVFCADLLPGVPWLLWLFWGAVIGAAFGLWTMAPIYGWRQQRPLIAASPFALLGVIFLIRLMLAHGA